MEASMYQLPVTLTVSEDSSIWEMSIEDAALLWALLREDADV
jgi:hypothetical protein